jgi:hypothetical protein
VFDGKAQLALRTPNTLTFFPQLSGRVAGIRVKNNALSGERAPQRSWRCALQIRWPFSRSVRAGLLESVFDGKAQLALRTPNTLSIFPQHSGISVGIGPK